VRAGAATRGRSHRVFARSSQASVLFDQVITFAQTDCRD
jgi:hypothetical protein